MNIFILCAQNIGVANKLETHTKTHRQTQTNMDRQLKRHGDAKKQSIIYNGICYNVIV